MKEKLNKYLRKKEVIIIIVLMIITLSALSYAFFINVDETGSNIARTECFKLTLQGSNDINLQSTYPMSEQEGSLLTPYTFTIKNICKFQANYQVNIETLNGSSLSTNYLRVKIDEELSTKLGTLDIDTMYINQNVKESRKLLEGSLQQNEEKTYNLRLWIDETSTVAESANKMYNGKIVVKAEQEIDDGDLSIAVVTDGVSSSFPTRDEAALERVECKDINDNDVPVSFNSNTWTITNLTVEEKTRCTFYFTRETVSSSNFLVGDFVEFTPTLTSYTPTTDSSSVYFTGTSTPGTINPSELTKWVVIKNQNDTIEMVSYNVSSTGITFYGLTGYYNYIGALNEIARAYTNESFIDTSKIRHFGYLAGYSAERVGSKSSDTYYSTDVNLVRNALGVRSTATLAAKNNAGVSCIYYVSSRYYDNNNDNSGNYLYVRTMNTNGSFVTLSGGSGSCIWATPNRNFYFGYPVRPIVTLKANVNAFRTGDGSEEHPWILTDYHS